MQSSTKTSVKYLHLCYVRASLLSTCSTKENRNADLVNNTESDWKSPLWSKFYINAGLFCICSLCIWGFTVIFRDAVSCSSIQVALCLQVIWLFCLLVIYTSLAVRVKDTSNSEKALTLQTMFGLMANASRVPTVEEGWLLLTHHSINMRLRWPTKMRLSHHSEASVWSGKKNSFIEW